MIMKRWKFVVVFVLLLLLVGYLWLKWQNAVAIVPENNDTLKYKLQPSLFQKEQDLLFEREDIKYYRETPLPLHQQINFINDINEYDLTETPRVEIADADRQNVHERHVNKYIRKIFSGMGVDENHSTLKEIIRDAPEDKKEEIANILHEIEKRNANITNLDNANELSVLSSVWEKAKGNENIKDMMYQQILDARENGNVVCPTGVANRLVSSLAVEDPSLFPKTKEMITQEILQKASKLMVDDESENCHKDQFKEKLVTELERDYAGILTNAEILEFIEPWIDSI